MLDVYRQLVQPQPGAAQVFRINCRWDDVKNKNFSQLLAAGLRLGVLPLALAGYKEHEIPARPGRRLGPPGRLK